MQSKAESVKSKGTFKVVNKRDSVIVHEGNEAGWINKLADRDSAAKAGDGWKSEAFNIVPTSSANTPISPTAPNSHK